MIVVSADKGGEADKEGIKSEDLILAVNGEKISTDADFWGIITEMNIGDKAKLKILRNGEEFEKEIEVKTK